jgi:hypothetical protein
MPSPKVQAAIVAAVALVLLGIMAIRESMVSIAPVSMNEPDQMAACEEKTLAILKLDHVALGDLGGIHGLCYAKVNEQDTLLEFGIRRGEFISQQREKPVLMWMVVIMTLSGVLLAGLQLLTAYNLALAGRGTLDQPANFSVERTKLAFGSSVSGLTILVISIAFFYIFVSQVYLITELGPPHTKSIAGGPDPTFGWRPLPTTLNARSPSSENRSAVGASSLAPSAIATLPLTTGAPGSPSGNSQTLAQPSDVTSPLGHAGK